MLAYLALRIGDLVGRALPPSWGYGLAGLMGSLFYRLKSDKRQTISANLAQVLGTTPDEPEIARLARRTFKNYAMYWWELLRMPHLKVRDRLKMIEFEGREHLDEALSQGRGVIFVAPHLGNWDMAATCLADQGYQIQAIAERLAPEALFGWFRSTRAALGIKIIPLDEAAKPALRAVKNNEIVGLICDRDLTGSGIEVNFFGKKTTLPAGPANLAIHTGAVILPGYLVRVSGHRFQGRILPPLEWSKSGDTRADIQAGTEKVVEFLEGLISSYPDQWYMFQPIWDRSELSQG